MQRHNTMSISKNRKVGVLSDASIALDLKEKIPTQHAKKAY